MCAAATLESSVRTNVYHATKTHTLPSIWDGAATGARSGSARARIYSRSSVEMVANTRAQTNRCCVVNNNFCSMKHKTRHCHKMSSRRNQRRPVCTCPNVRAFAHSAVRCVCTWPWSCRCVQIWLGRRMKHLKSDCIVVPPILRTRVQATVAGVNMHVRAVACGAVRCLCTWPEWL